MSERKPWVHPHSNTKDRRWWDGCGATVVSARATQPDQKFKRYREVLSCGHEQFRPERVNTNYRICMECAYQKANE